MKLSREFACTATTCRPSSTTGLNFSKERTSLRESLSHTGLKDSDPSTCVREKGARSQKLTLCTEQALRVGHT